jgi:hypothetical protein
LSDAIRAAISLGDRETRTSDFKRFGYCGRFGLTSARNMEELPEHKKLGTRQGA